jgi:hypothetical protein
MIDELIHDKWLIDDDFFLTSAFLATVITFAGCGWRKSKNWFHIWIPRSILPHRKPLVCTNLKFLSPSLFGPQWSGTDFPLPIAVTSQSRAPFSTSNCFHLSNLDQSICLFNRTITPLRIFLCYEKCIGNVVLERREYFFEVS